ncbi:MAG: putative lipid II flippase FtsW [bacterium]
MNRQGVDVVLLIAVLVLLVFSVCFVYTASSAKAERTYDDSAFYLKKQLLRLALGLALMFAMLRADYHQVLRWSPLLYGISAILLAVLLFLPDSMAIRGAHRWINIGSIQVQPSELAKFSLILYLAANLTKPSMNVRNFTDGLLPQLLLIGALVLLVAIEPDMGTAMLIALIALMMLFMQGAQMQHLFALISSGALIALALLSRVAYQRGRVEAFVESMLGDSEPAWQVKQSLIGLGNGGLTGLGLGKSKQKLFFLPDPFTDFIMSVIGEELGLIGTLIVMTMFFVILWRGFKIARQAPDASGRLLALGITAAIGIGAFVNIAVVTNMLPTTGVPLPFVSYGGSSLLVHLMAIGLLLNISLQSEGNKKPKKGVASIPLAQVRWYRDRQRGN